MRAGSDVSKSLRRRGSPVRGIFPGRDAGAPGLPFPCPGGLPDAGVKPTPLASPASVGGFFTTEPPGKPSGLNYFVFFILAWKNLLVDVICGCFGFPS